MYKTVICSLDSLEQQLNLYKDSYDLIDIHYAPSNVYITLREKPAIVIQKDSGITLEKLETELKSTRWFWPFVFVFCLFTSIASAGPFFDVEELYIDAHKFTGHSNDNVNNSIGRQIDKGLTLGLTLDVLGFAYINNILDSRTGCINGEQCQFSEISYNFDVGTRLTKWLDFVYSHTSTHALDNSFGYQVEDQIGLRLYLIHDNDQKDSLLR